MVFNGHNSLKKDGKRMYLDPKSQEDSGHHYQFWIFSDDIMKSRRKNCISLLSGQCEGIIL